MSTGDGPANCSSLLAGIYTAPGTARAREGREGEMPTDETTHVYEYPSGTGTAPFYIRGGFVYSIGGEAAYCICGDYWYPYPPCPSRPAFWVSGKLVYEYLSLVTPKYCMA